MSIQIMVKSGSNVLTYNVDNYVIKDNLISFFDSKTSRKLKIPLHRLIEVVEW